MEVHLFALCWNECSTLPFFFRHYDRIVSKYFIYDNGSTDGSVEFLSRETPNNTSAAGGIGGCGIILDVGATENGLRR